ncbi:deoxyhypusine hydroxylase-like [Halichondria panicea]|uniref:deoxyhypusine hydroxylase-like n=1 Tax=Halichondria panicea TaxID=6063 RepID=UPI00312B9954
MASFSHETVEKVGAILNNSSHPLAERFRALFTLKGIGTPEAITQISRAFTDTSALLKHECAYCLGQIRHSFAISKLEVVLRDISQESMVRHEAAEALGAIGDPSVCPTLEEYVNDSAKEVAETCQIALDRIKWLHDKDNETFEDNNPYNSVDPAPPIANGSIEEWKVCLNDSSLPLFPRYRAMFALRNHGGQDAVLALVSGFLDHSALFKHELAYILGQMKDCNAIPALMERLNDKSENSMVRHECAEALGSIATEQCLEILEQFKNDTERVVKESCDVAIDMYHYENSEDFQYANAVDSTQ